MTTATPQSQGISHVNIAVSQMDKLAQGNAASAGESAAAAEMLSAHAIAMEQTVADLGILHPDFSRTPRPYANFSN